MRRRQTYELDYHYCPTCKNELKFLPQNDREYLTCDQCQFTFWNNPKPVVSGLFMKSNKVLLIYRKAHSYKDYWSLPGGIISTFEDPIIALKREFFEETNYVIDVGEILEANTIIYIPKGRYKKPSYTSVDIIYRVNIKNFDPTKIYQVNNDEISKINIFSSTNLPKRIAFYHRKVINKFAFKIR